MQQGGVGEEVTKMIKLWDEIETKIHRLTGPFSISVMRVEVTSCKKQ